jgi:hypothetical protein
VVAAEEPAAAPSLTDQETLIDFLATLRGEIFADDPEPAAAAPAPADPEAVAPSRPEAAAPAPADQPDGQEQRAAQAIAPGARQLDPPIPPARSAVAARMASPPHVVDELLDESIAQAPLPPGQTAVVARLEAPRQLDAAPPLPAPRPAVTLTAGVSLPSARPLVLPPPPTKPAVPVRSSGTWEPAPNPWAALQPEADSPAHTRERMIVANASA